MHDDPPMSEELAARFYPRFEGGWRVAEVVGRTLMLVAVVATLFGLLGGGPVYLWTRTVSAAGVSVTYQPVARFGTPSGLDVTIPVAPGAKEVAVTLPDAIAGGFDLQSVTPRPTRWEPGDGAMRLAFTPMPDARCRQDGGPPRRDATVRRLAHAQRAARRPGAADLVPVHSSLIRALDPIA